MKGDSFEETTMNRRSFIAMLPMIPVAVGAAVRAVTSEPDWRNDILISRWFQTPQFTYVATLEYQDALDLAMGFPDAERRANWHARRISWARSNLAMLRTQRPLPLP